MRIGEVAARAALSALLLGVVVVLGQIPWGAPSDEGVLRLALRTVRGKLEVCRESSAAELEELPAHMRGARDCDTYPVAYRLRVAMDERERLDLLVEPGGLRRDRPHNVDRELRAPPGIVSLEVRFEPQAPADPSPEMSQAFAALPSYELRRPVRLEADRVTLIYLDDAAGELEVVGP